jgi:hypothetical protein
MPATRAGEREVLGTAPARGRQSADVDGPRSPRRECRPTVRAGRDYPDIGSLEHDQPLLWSSRDDRALMPPQRQLLEQIAVGELDQHLVAIADAVRARRELLHSVSSAKAIAELRVGDT